ncbi:RICIN domain-containing protein [Actinokineospora inagensis]|uniref:RICIN domain-containing protein n=1 Tax=Actinokineospora inagensis TaxID=103730 RepID=UPI000414B8D1|nr:RICIN domain-containing protein [Actinokineospora inagensis]
MLVTTGRRRGLARLGAVLVGAVALALALTATPANAASAPKAPGTASLAGVIPNQIYRFINTPTLLAHSECLGYAPTRRGAAWIGDCFGQTPGTTGDATVFWTPVQVNANYYELVNSINGQCLSIQDGSVAEGANVQVFPCHGSDDQLFAVVPYNIHTGTPDFTEYEIQNYHSGKCVSVGGGLRTAGSWVIQWTCHGGLEQLWTLRAGTV